LVLRLCVHALTASIAGFGGSARTREADPEFYPLATEVANIQQSGEIGLRVKKNANQTESLMYWAKAKPSDRDGAR